jgi:hypothetical protein
MAVTKLQKPTTEIVSAIQAFLPEVILEQGDSFYWSPRKQIITYKVDDLGNDHGLWAFLHEAAHAHLGHSTYENDVELLLLEVEAWQAAKNIGSKLKIIIDEDHIQDCLDTYRDWLHHRSTCPTCGVVCFQDSPSSYHCHNCQNSWTVSASRFCRPYRLSKYGAQKEKLPTGAKPQATFQ